MKPFVKSVLISGALSAVSTIAYIGIIEGYNAIKKHAAKKEAERANNEPHVYDTDDHTVLN